ncbi:Acetyltransferase (GNAT) family protein [Micromonospora sp. MW-13]|uniref:GNAT family N-acetyltransferase n=1 Tax=unclassified Micromonospora TaxID=2617518 RepID=UPI000EE82AF0|nr:MULTISPECIES: GNAT family N-acetyltransferase [unclassified Micromonospora]MCX4471506.1 GNAT family N-acetyltransferase [Micromonospora sp. NBC_01655]RGC65637.1 Acetyltransferase (GNAT) family protein [Micromonospora sp. MW-13]
MNFTFRRATPEDVPAVLRLFDDVIAWFVSIGNDEQWGTEPWSTQERQIERVTEACALPGAWVTEHAELGVCGALVLGDAMPYVPPATDPEVYVRLVIGSRDPRAKGVGRRLLALADDQARAAGVSRLRVDCYGGGTGALVRFYESCGYERISTFVVDGWPGQLLGRTL